VLALLFASPSTALRPTLTHNPCPRHVMPSVFEEFAESVWRLPSWQRGAPKAKTIAAAHHQIYCARGTGRRGTLKQRWREARREFYRHRHDVRELIALAPYSFGEPTLGRVAIPPYVVRCETQGYYGASRWRAVNRSSGARGPYQLLPSTYYGVCSSCDWSHVDQDRVAREVWDRSGGSEWACA
jgi:hypothetical protein